jgi:uncharacterized protein
MTSPAPRTDARAALPFVLCGTELEALGCGAVWWPEERLLAVADLHLEKGSSFAMRGQLLPPFDTRETLMRLGARMRALQPARVIVLGDSFHDRTARFRMADEDVALVRELTASCRWTWIAGNHDPLQPDDLGGESAPEVRLKGLVMRHEPTGESGEIAGHLHPCARVSGQSGSVRLRCFATDGERLILPAYGAFTGGLNVLDPAFDDVLPGPLRALAIGPRSVRAVARARLVPDAQQARRISRSG